MRKILAALALFILIATAGIGSANAQPLNKPYFFYKGRELIMEHNYSGAIEMLNMLLRTETQEYEGYFLRGVAKYNLDDLLGAEADFTQAIQINPNYTQALQYRGITRSRLGNFNDALQDFQQSVELRPNMPANYFSRGVTYFLSQQFEKAVDDFTRYLRSTPSDVSALTNRGICYLYLKDTTHAYTDFNRAVEMAPLEPAGYLRRGLLEVAQQQHVQGIADLTRALSLDPTLAIAYFYRASAYVDQSKPLLALQDLDSAIGVDSTNSVAYFNRAILRSQIGDYNRAILDYDRVALYNPGNVLVFYNRASVKAQIGDYRGAAEDYTRAIELYPDFANAYRYRSQLKTAMRDFRGAEADRRTAETKISSYRRKLADSTFASYADTSRQFDRLLSFDADFGNNELRSMVGNVQSEVRLQPMFRIALLPSDTSKIYSPRDYRNARLDDYYTQLGSSVRWGVANTTRLPLAEDSISTLDEANLNPINWSDNFRKGVTQTLLRQYASALSYYRRAEREDGNNPLIYLNQGVTQAEMVEFVASLGGNRAIQQISINTGSPETQLLPTGRERTRYDYSEAILYTRRAIDLMPELPHAYYNLANLMVLTGDMPGAFEQYSKAIELFPFFAEAYYNRGLVQIFLKDTQKGCLDLSKAGELGLDVAYETLKRYCVKLK